MVTPSVAPSVVGAPATVFDSDENSDEEDGLVKAVRRKTASKSEIKATTPPKPPRSTIIWNIAFYALCSSTLLVINKVAMYLLPDASIVLAAQFVASAVSMRVLSCARPDVVEVEGLILDKVKPFFLATFVFFLCLLSNTQALKSVNVETVIVIRSCSPIAVAFLENLTLGKALPSLKGLVSLLMIAGGACSYVLADEGFIIEGYLWLGFYFVSIVVEMVFVKYVVEKVPMTTWTRVYYNNMLSLPLVGLSWAAMGNPLENTLIKLANPSAMFALMLSAGVGVCISYAGFNLRKLVSATSFTVVGVMCKVLTVLINDCIWAKHSNAFGHASLLICIASGFLYEKVK